MAKPSERIALLAELKGAVIRSRQVSAIVEFLDEEWREKHQGHTDRGEACSECRYYGFVHSDKNI